jgi:hypothetical protein
MERLQIPFSLREFGMTKRTEGSPQTRATADPSLAALVRDDKTVGKCVRPQHEQLQIPHSLRSFVMTKRRTKVSAAKKRRAAAIADYSF